MSPWAWPRVGILQTGISSFWAQFLPELMATIIGVAIGIWGALWLERRHGRQARQHEEADLQQAARDAVEHNLELCKQLRDAINKDDEPMFPMDVGLLDAVFPRLVQVSHDTKMVRELNGFRYQLHHLNRKLDVWLASARENWQSLHPETRFTVRSELRSSVSQHVTMLQASGEKLRRLLTGTHGQTA